MESVLLTTSSVYDLPFLSAGVSSMVYASSDTTIIKAPCDRDRSLAALATKRTIYKRLGQHPYITRFLSAHGDSLILKRHQYPLRQRLRQLRDDGQTPPSQDVIRWASQIAQAFQHVHSYNVRQVDIGPHNILLDQHNNAQLSDFAGSSIDGSEPLVAPGEHFEHLGIPTPSVQSEIFALGSTFFEIETTREPYHDRTKREVQRLFQA